MAVTKQCYQNRYQENRGGEGASTTFFDKVLPQKTGTSPPYLSGGGGRSFLSKKLTEVNLATADVVVMNQYRRSHANRVGSFVVGTEGGTFAGVGTSTGRSVSQSYGDLVFLSGGRETMRFQGISDPQGVKSLVLALRKVLK